MFPFSYCFTFLGGGVTLFSSIDFLVFGVDKFHIGAPGLQLILHLSSARVPRVGRGALDEAK